MNRRFMFGYPHGGKVSVPFAMSMLNLVMNETTKDKEKCLLGSMREKGSCHVPFNRNSLIEFFLDVTSDDYIVMVDTDVPFQPDLFEKLDGHIESLSHIPIYDRKDHPHIIAGRVDIGNAGYPVFYQRVGRAKYNHDARPFKGLKHFDAVGSGIIAISHYCLDTIRRESRTYHFFGHAVEEGSFETPLMEKFNNEFKEGDPVRSRVEKVFEAYLKPTTLNKMMSDDFSFCLLARKHGFLPYGAWDIRGIHIKEQPIQPGYIEDVDEYNKFIASTPKESLPKWLREDHFVWKDEEEKK